jgi:glycerol-3-phosphate responsive antiterminator
MRAIEQLKATVQEQEYTILLLRGKIVKLQAAAKAARKRKKVVRG